MRFSRLAAFGLVFALILTTSAQAQRGDLKTGDAAPGLDIDAWVEGGEMTLEPGRPYIVIFWEPESQGGHAAGDTLKALQHLQELMEQYGIDGLVILAISTADAAAVETAVRTTRQKLGFNIAADRRRATHRAWVDASGTNASPAAFIVSPTARIAYIGTPLDDNFDGILAKVVDGRYDPQLAARARPDLRAARRNRSLSQWREAKRHYDTVIRMDPHVFADIALERAEMVLIDMKDPEQAYDYVKNDLMGNLFRADAGALRMLAEKIANDPHPELTEEIRDRDLALTAAKQALLVSGKDDPRSLATLGLVYYSRQELDQAVDYQFNAWRVAHPTRKPEYQRTLRVYQAAQRRANETSQEQ